MTFNTTIPLASDSPGLFPAQSQANFTRLQTLLGADHQFNNTAAANDGYHNLIRMTQQGPSGVLAATGRLYVKTSGSFVQLFYMDDAGREYQVTPGIIAAVNFNGTGASGVNQTIRSSLNVTSVFKNSTGDYTITFTTPIANNNYIVSITGMRDTNDDISNGQVRGSVSYNSSVTTTTLRVQFNGGSAGLNNVLMGNILVYSL